MRILITGGNGYVGRELCRLLQQEHDICVVDNLRFGEVRFRTEGLEKLRIERIDIRDKKAIKDLFANFSPEIIIHLAAIHFIPECESDPVLAVSTNVVGTVNLLASCPASCHFIFASSGAVYQPEDKPHLESSSIVNPLDIYGFTKLQGEEYVRYFATQRGFSATIARLFNVVGPGETNPHVLPEIIAQLKSGRRVLRLGNLDTQRDYIHVRDAAAGFAALALTGRQTSGKSITVNLGTQQTYSVKELLIKLQGIVGVKFDVECDPSRLRPSDRPFLAANIGEIQRLFNWRPQLTIDTALHDLWANPDLPDYLVQKYKL